MNAKQGHVEATDEDALCQVCYLNGKRATLHLNEDEVAVLRWSQNPQNGKGTSRLLQVSLTDIVGVSLRTALQQNTASTCCRHHDGPAIILHSFRRKHLEWCPLDHMIEFLDEPSAQHWVTTLQQRLDRQMHRPAHLFVLINPFGGSQRADKVWLESVKPVFESARISSDAFRTGYRDHAVELLQQMPLDQFLTYDGIVSIGGDGLFQECLRGILCLRAKGGEWAEKANSIRIGQIPAGSTDTIACTVNGSRSVLSAALHIALGDRTLLDVLEVRTREGECRYACSTASYGFVGDVLDSSETIRWMGPVRYDVSGAFTLARLKSYPIRLWYQTPALPHPKRIVCGTGCSYCAKVTDSLLNGNNENEVFAKGSSATNVIRSHPSEPGCNLNQLSVSNLTISGSNLATLSQHKGSSDGQDNVMHSEDDFLHPLSPKNSLCTDPESTWFGPIPQEETWEDAAESEGWKCWEGEIVSLMVVVTPTRSDKMKAGIIPHSHLADGRMHLVIVRKCSRLQFFQFLLSLASGGVDERLPFVEVKEVHAWRVEELQPKVQGSVWNVDGELMQSRYMSARCHQGMVHVFARGPETDEKR